MSLCTVAVTSIYVPLSLIALPPPNVTISSASGSAIAGQSYIIICSVQVVPYLAVEPRIEWIKQDSGTPVTTNLPFLVFNPLKISDGGRYICNVSVTVSGDTVSAMNSTDVRVNSK